MYNVKKYYEYLNLIQNSFLIAYLCKKEFLFVSYFDIIWIILHIVCIKS